MVRDGLADRGCMDERVEMVLPRNLIEKIDSFVELIGSERREGFVETAVRRLVDQRLLIVGRDWNGRG